MGIHTHTVAHDVKFPHSQLVPHSKSPYTKGKQIHSSDHPPQFQNTRIPTNLAKAYIYIYIYSILTSIHSMTYVPYLCIHPVTFSRNVWPRQFFSPIFFCLGMYFPVAPSGTTNLGSFVTLFRDREPTHSLVRGRSCQWK